MTSGYKYGIDPELEFTFRCAHCDEICYTAYDDDSPKLRIYHEGPKPWDAEANYSDSSEVHTQTWSECRRREEFAIDAVSV